MSRAPWILLACVLATSATATSASAFLNPYVRVGFGANRMAMNDANTAISQEVGMASAAGVPVSAKTVGPGFGPSFGAGIWIVPFLRVGATYSQERSNVDHEYRETGYLYQNDFSFRVKEAGLEAAVRIPPLAGLTFGGRVAESTGEAERNFALENIHGNYYEGFSATTTKKTYAVFFGLDQNEERGFAGYLLVGYHWRDLGTMPATLHVNDNGSMYDVQGTTVPMDYSGWSVKLGIGYDLKWSR